MTEKQLEFEFMKNTILRVTSLGYIGGQDGGLGGYCEALEIKYTHGPEEFVLHAMRQSRTGYDPVSRNFSEDSRVENHHTKIIFSSREGLLQAWASAWLYLNSSQRAKLWRETTPICDTDSTPEEFYRTKREERKVA